MRALTAGAAQHGHTALAVQQGGEPVEIRRRGRHHRLGQQQTRQLGGGGARCRLQGDVALVPDVVKKNFTNPFGSTSSSNRLSSALAVVA